MKAPPGEDERHFTMESPLWWEQLQSKLIRYSTTILVFETDRRGNPKTNGYVQGSGVLVRYQGHEIVATCRHIFQEVEGPFKVIVLAKQTEQRGYMGRDFLSMERVVLNQRGSELKDDLAYIDLGSESKQGLPFFPVSYLEGVVTNACSVVGCGTPDEPNIKKPGFPLELLTRVICRYGELKSDIDWSPEGKRLQDIFVSKMDSYEYFDGVTTLKPPSTYVGMSGGGLWGVFDQKITLLGLILQEDSTSFTSVCIDRWLDFAGASLK